MINTFRFGSAQAEIRALVEGQMLHRKAVATDMGFNFGEDTRILATGGASCNRSILQVVSDVFNAPVYVQNNSEAALFGAAYRAKYALYLADAHSSRPESFHDFMQKLLPHHMHRVCDPSKDSSEIYTPMVLRYRQMIQSWPSN